MRRLTIAALIVFAGAMLLGVSVSSRANAAEPRSWDPNAAAAYLDARQDWWMKWPSAARDHDTACVSCHTTLPYALSRSALRTPLNERGQSPPSSRSCSIRSSSESGRGRMSHPTIRISGSFSITTDRPGSGGRRR